MSDEKKTETDEERTTRETKTAVTAYTLVTGMMVELAKRADETTAKNFVGLDLQGFNVGPFDRVNINFMRPGGVTPNDLIKEMREKTLAIRRAVSRARGLVKGIMTEDEVTQLRHALSDVMRDLTLLGDPSAGL